VVVVAPPAACKIRVMKPEPGISWSLAQARSTRISDLRYALTFTIPLDVLEPVRAHEVITFMLADVMTPLVLDFAPHRSGHLRSCSCNRSPSPPVVENGHIVIPADALSEGANEIQLEFDAGDAPLNRRDDHLYTIFVPARAHEAFPCFDQPDLKATWALTLDMPGDWTAVANAPEFARRTRVATDGAGSRRLVVEFADTEPIPTYLFAFAAGAFAVETAQRDGRELRMFHRERDMDRVARNDSAIVDAHAEALRWLEAYTGVAYAFGKFDIVLLPAFQFGGMEHPGAIFYNADALLLPSSATRQQLLARANVIAHETAHMWFGDLVTMTWFDDVWMKEVFANFMAAKIVNPQFPDLDHALRFLHGHYPAAYDVDRTAGANAIRQPLANLNDAGSLYGAIVYLKSPIVMRQLELLIGEASLRDALRAYLVRYRFGNAAWPDLLDLLAARSTVDIAGWSRDWVDEPGRPVVRAELQIDGDIVSSIRLRASDAVAGRGRTWPQHLDVAIGYGSRVEHARVWLDGAFDLATLVGTTAPDYVLPNGGGLGYGEFRLDARSREWLMQHLPDVSDAVTRGSAWLTLWDGMLCGEIPPDALLDLSLQCLPLEDSELNVQCILGSVERLFWIFLLPAARTSRAARAEQVLRTGIGVAPTAPAKAAWFACLRAIATTDSGVGWLHALWSGKARIDGLPLEEADRIALARELAVRPGSKGDAIVQQQLASTTNEDRRAALAFIAPALSADTADRDRFFATISAAANRRREPWVIEGMRCLHHPLRATSALKYLDPGLRLLEEVKHTGDIFLPKRWLDAMLSGHRSPEAAAIVRAFLDGRPADYHPALRRMVLASADQLFRVAERRV
jgi:aminopeptidase N